MKKNKNKFKPPRLVVTVGDPAGIGPEIILRALAQRRLAASIQPWLVGPVGVLRQTAKRLGLPWRFQTGTAWKGEAPLPSNTLPVVEPPVRPQPVKPGQWTPYTGEVSLAAVALAVEFIQAGQADALVTGPICKEAWFAAGARYPGHTELLAELTNTTAYGMMFVNGPFRLVLATVHVPLRQVSKVLSVNRIVQITRLAVADLQRRFGVIRPRIAVAGLNPHAGEGGLFGDEEQCIIAPAVLRLATENRWDVTGPVVPDALFAEAAKGVYDLVVCMYHDQGLIPFKLLALHTGVNVTVGLPIIRTSPDHGTAFQLAGTGQANPGSMHAALVTAAKMVRVQQNITG